MSLGGQGGVVDNADQRVANIGRVERLQDRHGVASPAAAGIVGDVGEDHGASAVASGQPDGFVQAGQRGAEAVAARPTGFGDLPRPARRRPLGRWRLPPR